MYVKTTASSVPSLANVGRNRVGAFTWGCTGGPWLARGRLIHRQSRTYDGLVIYPVRLVDVGHQSVGHQLPSSLDADAAQSVAATLRALANPSRLRILATLQAGPATVGDLMVALDIEQSAVSHQLKLLRDQGFVAAERHGRHIEYRLYDNHVGELIEQALSHAEHVRLGSVERQPATPRSG
ncbi:ArsR/SmtB family transcription factor [Nocardioides alpinus]|uniref:ArsR/SmtB family transcription factor n=1 Tax=Nocardioides alpinus TaxID=748909 RepID=UPI001E511DD9|nr:metalloregulator ArsR/SmtB family transcription factor [Nocardioides alpinus]